MANLLPIRINYEDWAEAHLPDGTLIRFRPALAMVLEEGQEKWQFRVQQQYQVHAPEALRRPTHAMTKRLGPVSNVVLQGKAHSSYEVDGRTLHLTMDLAKVFRTDGYDANGDPIFHIEHRDQFKMHGGPEQPPTPTPA